MASQTIWLNEDTAALRRVYIRLVLASDGVSPATSGQVTAGVCRLIANGADGGANTAANITETHSTNAPGRWYVELSGAELTALGVGHHAVRFKETDTLESIGGEFDVVNWDYWAAGVTVASFAANAITATAINADAITAAKVASDVGTEFATALLDLAAGVETGLTVRQFARLAASALFGLSSDDGKTYRDFGDTKNRLVGTVDVDGNRTAITYDAT